MGADNYAITITNLHLSSRQYMRVGTPPRCLLYGRSLKWDVSLVFPFFCPNATNKIIYCMHQGKFANKSNPNHGPLIMKCKYPTRDNRLSTEQCCSAIICHFCPPTNEPPTQSLSSSASFEWNISNWLVLFLSLPMHSGWSHE